MAKVSYEDIQKKLMDIDTPDSEIREFLMVDPEHTGAFNPRFVLNPDLVEISDEEMELESAMGFGNAMARYRRHRRFKRRIKNNDPRPVLVAEGDSWFQFPFIIDEVIDHLGDDYSIWSLGAAGDTAANMTGNRSEYMRGLNKWSSRVPVRGFLFSAAGNDVIGEDESGQPVLEKLLKPYQAGADPAWHIDRDAFSDTLSSLSGAYRKVMNTIRNDERYTELPMFIHGYDYAYPFPFSNADKRKPFWADKDEWLGKPFTKLGFTDPEFRRAVIKILIDALYDMLFDVASADVAGQVHVVDVRGILSDLDDWADEIHGTSAGFKKVAACFKTAIDTAI